MSIPRTFIQFGLFTITFISEHMCFKYPFSVYKCGKCPECLQSKRNEWSVRLQLHTLYSAEKPYFCHLTYDNLHVPKTDGGKYTLSKIDIDRFFKRLRINLKRQGYEIKIQYFLCGEYGPSTFRPHYHCVIFGLPKVFSDEEARQVISKAWQNGDVRQRSCWLKDFGQLHYVTKYMINYDYVPHDVVKPFKLCSSGLGHPFIDYALENDLFDIETQLKFKPTRIYLDKRNNKHAVSWCSESPLIIDNDGCLTVNPILKGFRDFIEITSFCKGRMRNFRFNIPEYFKKFIYTDDFRMALAEKKNFELLNRSVDYQIENLQYDSNTQIPMWLQLKRYKWQKFKKTKKDKLFYKSKNDLIL